MQPDSKSLQAELIRRRVRQMDEARGTTSETEKPSYPRQVFLAKTTAVDGDYPDSNSSPETYPLVFLTGTFDDSTPGSANASFIEHSASKQVNAFAVCEGFVQAETKVFAWRQNARWWFLPCEGSSTSKSDIDIVQLCDDVTNECCVWPGVLLKPLRPEEQVDLCSVDLCTSQVWLWCLSRPGPDHPFPIDQINWCGWGKKLIDNFNCNGDERPVYLVDCGECPSICPSECQEVDVTLRAFSCVANPISFKAYGVSVDPMPLTPGPDSGWWGEFTLQGEYPMTGMWFAVEPFNVLDSQGVSQEVDQVFIVVGCGGSDSTIEGMGTATQYYIDIGDGLQPYAGGFTFDLQQGAPWSPTGIWEPVTDQSGCQMFCTRTFKYGIFFQCERGQLLGGTLYHLWPEASLTRQVDQLCDASVPTAGQYFPQAEGLEVDPNSGQANCDFKDVLIGDVAFGRSWPVGRNVVVTGETSDREISANPIQWHLMGGCRDDFAHHYGQLPVCSNSPTVTTVEFEIDWTAGEEECA